MSTEETKEAPISQENKQDSRTDKKGGGKDNKGIHSKSSKGDRVDTTGFKKHPHGNNYSKNQDSNYIKKAAQGDQAVEDQLND